jgi:hypothetical protein
VRSAAVPERAFRIHAFDRATGARIERPIATFDRGPGSWQNSYAPREVYVRRVHEGLRCRVEAAGHVGADVSLVPVLEATGDATPTLRVELAPGLEAAVRTLDEETGAPLAGVVLSAEGESPVRSDELGRARIEAARWQVWRATRAGYEEATWDPHDHVLFRHGDLFLRPLR